MASTRVRVCVSYGGTFSGGSYLGGVAELMRINYGRQMYSEVVSRVQALLKADPCNFEYILWAVFDGRERNVKMKIESSEDILELIEEQKTPNIYVELEKRVNVGIPGTAQQSFTQMMASQGVFPSSFGVGSSAFSHEAPYSHQAGPSSFTHTGYPRGADDQTAGCSNQPGHSRDDDNNDDQTNTHNGDSGDEDKEVHEKQMFKLFRAWYSEHIEELRLITDHIEVESLAYMNRGSTRQSDVEPRMWSLPMPPTTTGSDRQPIHLPSNNIELSLGSVFLSKEELICAIQLYHLQQKVECRTPKSCTSRLLSVCRYEGCSYKLCARAKRDVWRITTLKLEHTCEGSLTHNRHRSANSKVLAHIYASTIQTNPQTVSTRRIIEQMREEDGLSISYNVSLRARHRAFEKVYGGHEESWGRLPGYLHMLQVRNPGTIVELQRDGEVFQHLFFALGASIEGFQRAGVPVIVIDGTHLKGKYKGIMFVAATLDGNHQIFPLAVGIGDVERRETWSWFLTQLKRAYGCPDNLLIVSDRHESIIYSVPIVFPEAHHSFCCYHITKQMRPFGKSVLDIFYKAAYCYRRENFYRYLSSIQSLKPEAFKKLTNEIPVNAWARCFTPVRRYGFMTSNSCESLNNKLRWARMLPVCSLLECVRATIEKWFAVRRASAEGRNHPLTQWTQLRLDPLFEKGRTLSITTLGMQRYRVMEETRSYVVDLEARTCDCRVFETDLLPCLHASTAIR